MDKAPHEVGKTRNTLLFALILLFFFQLVGMWMESIYRLSLIKLEPGKELCGVFLLLLPLLVFAVSEKRERGFLWGVMPVLLGCRVLCPLLGSVGQVIVGGVGVSAFLVILSYALSARFRSLQGDIGQALGVAVLLSVMLRSWRSTVDVSTEGATIVIGWLLVLLALHLFRRATLAMPAASAATAEPCARRTPAMLGLFANLTLVYLVFSSPAVVCAWSGYGRLGSSGVVAVACTAVGFAAVIVAGPRLRSLPSHLLRVWNLFLIALIVCGIQLGKAAFPTSPESPALFLRGDALRGAILLYAALLLAPVVLLNARHIAELSCFARPRRAVPPVMLGMGLLFALTLLLIFSNVWGYVPFGRLLRNRFYLPFLLAGIGILIPWMMGRREQPSSEPMHGRLLGSLAVSLAILAVAGTLVRLPHPEPAESKRVLTVMTYNMQQGTDAHGNRDYAGQLDLLRRINPDIIGLQECDTARPSGGNVDAVRYFAESLGYHAYYGPGSITGTFGTAILSRYPIRNPRTFFTYSDPDEVGTAVAEIDVAGTTTAFFSNHPAGGDDVMNAHVNALIMEARKYERVIAVGDYNFRPATPYFARLSSLLVNSASQLGEKRLNTHGMEPDLARAIDHIFLSRNFSVLESHYLPPPDSRTDHPAHWSVVRME